MHQMVNLFTQSKQSNRPHCSSQQTFLSLIFTAPTRHFFDAHQTSKVNINILMELFTLEMDLENFLLKKIYSFFYSYKYKIKNVILHVKKVK